MSGGAVVKCACRIRIVQCKLVSIKWEGGDFHVTADHSLLVRRGGESWFQIEADCVLEGDEIMVLDTHVLGIAVQEVLVKEVDDKDLDVVEVELENPTTTMFVASSCRTGPYVGVLGKQPENSYLGILVMEVSRRPKELVQAFRKSNSLHMCQAVSGKKELESGALLFLTPAHYELFESMRQHGKLGWLQGRHLVFTAEYRKEIEQVVSNLPSKCNVKVLWCKRVLDKCSFFDSDGLDVGVCKTFVDVRKEPSIGGSHVETTVSTTDARSSTRYQNPRKRRNPDSP